MTAQRHASTRPNSTRPDQARTHRSQAKPTRPQTVLLDRLAQALTLQRVSLKRTALQSVAASAFGYRNGHEFAAADLAPPKAVVLGRALSAEQSFVVLRDPVAGLSYAVPASELPGQDAERADLYGVSPYGHILDLEGLKAANQAVTADGTHPLHGATFTSPDSLITFGGETVEALNRALADHCRKLADEQHLTLTETSDDAATIASYLTQADGVGIDYRDLRDPVGAPSAPGEAVSQMIHVALRHGWDGVVSYSAATRKDLDAQIADYCRRTWSQGASKSPITDYATDAEIIAAYFNEHEVEDLIQGMITAPVAGVTAPVTNTEAATSVWLAVHEYDDGHTLYADATKAGLHRQICIDLKAYWRDVEAKAGPFEALANDEARVEAYFDASSDLLTVEEKPLTLASVAPSADQVWRDQVAAIKAEADARNPGEGWSEHPDYDAEAWQEAVANGDTRSGYWEWVAQMLDENGTADLDDPNVYFGNADTGVDVSNDPLPDPVYLRKDWEAGYALGLHHLPYDEWVDEQFTAKTAQAEQWLTPQSLKAHQYLGHIADTWDAILRVPLVERTNDGKPIHVRPGTLVRVIAARSRGDVRMTILLDQNVSVTFRPEERSGFFPLSIATSKSSSTGAVEHPLYTREDWRAAVARGACSVEYDAFRKAREELDVHRREDWFRGSSFRNIRGRHSFTVHVHGLATLPDRPGQIDRTLRYAPGEIVALESAEFTGPIGHVVLRTAGGALFTLHTRDASGILPISLIVPQHQRDQVVHPQEDWLAEMKATGQTGVYPAWLQTISGSETRDRWLTTSGAEALQRGEPVRIHVFGDTDPSDPRGESYTLDYSPGDKVVFLGTEERRGHRRYVFKTKDGGVFTMSPSERGGFLPMSALIETDTPFGEWIRKVVDQGGEMFDPESWRAYFVLGYAPVNAIAAFRRDQVAEETARTDSEQTNG